LAYGFKDEFLIKILSEVLILALNSKYQAFIQAI